jgi:hypothetical protein
MPTRAADSDEVSMNIMRLQNVCPGWINTNFDILTCWCHSSRQESGKRADCPKKPDDWKPGMPGILFGEYI